mmetsp:Transcript_30042/g.82464  ORF Transcript_30042/g.82464 Transcript_30042/m.82464 type:complete len:213 (+) Transcript_30042:335-973(+)
MASFACRSARRAASKCRGWKAPTSDHPPLAHWLTLALSTNAELRSAMRPAATTSAKRRLTSGGKPDDHEGSSGAHAFAPERSLTRGGGASGGGTWSANWSKLGPASEATDIASLLSGAHTDTVSLLASNVNTSTGERTSSESPNVDMDAIDGAFNKHRPLGTRFNGSRATSPCGDAPPRIALGGADDVRLRGCWSCASLKSSVTSTKVFLMT